MNSPFPLMAPWMVIVGAISATITFVLFTWEWIARLVRS